MAGTPAAGTNGLSAPLPGAGRALALLLAINLFNYIDRQVLAAVEPQIRRQFFPGPRDPVTGETLKDDKGKERDGEGAGTLMGLLSTAFLVTYMVAAPLFGWLSTRLKRWVLVGFGVVIWSLASGASGLAGVAHVYLLLLVTRCFVGVGEAAYGPVAPDMISDFYPVRKRGRGSTPPSPSAGRWATPWGPRRCGPAATGSWPSTWWCRPACCWACGASSCPSRRAATPARGKRPSPTTNCC